MDSTIVIHFPANVEYSAFNLIKINAHEKKASINSLNILIYLLILAPYME